MKQAFHTSASKSRFASNEPHTNYNERKKMNEEELFVTLLYCIITCRTGVQVGGTGGVQ